MYPGLDSEQRLPEESRDLASKPIKSHGNLWHCPFPRQTLISHLCSAWESTSVYRRAQLLSFKVSSASDTLWF